MAYFSTPNIERVTLASNADYWVDISTDFRYGELKEFADLDGDTINFAVAGDRFLLATIKAWNLDDESGAVLPINSETIDLLKKEDVMLIFGKANAEVVEDNKKKDSSSTK